MVTLMLVVFVIGYLLIAFEHVIHINKATFAPLCASSVGYLCTRHSRPGYIPRSCRGAWRHLRLSCFFIGAMTIVELIDRYGGFHIIVKHIRAENKRGLMWVLAFCRFLHVEYPDNMTTTIIMVMMLRRMLRDQKERWLFACVIVIAANSGGAWSPIGDITTIMLWMKNYVSSVDLIVNLLVPCIVSVVIPRVPRFAPDTACAGRGS